MVDVKRRDIAFESLTQIVDDVERLASGEYHTTGNHSFAAIVEHLAKTNDMVTGKIVPPKLPWYFRVVMPLMRSKIFNSPVKPGFKLPARMQSFFWQEQEPVLKEAVVHLKESTAHFEEQGPLPNHAVFGPATPQQALEVTLKHAAMHLSFVHPGQG